MLFTCHETYLTTSMCKFGIYNSYVTLSWVQSQQKHMDVCFFEEFNKKERMWAYNAQSTTPILKQQLKYSYNFHFKWILAYTFFMGKTIFRFATPIDKRWRPRVYGPTLGRELCLCLIVAQTKLYLLDFHMNWTSNLGYARQSLYQLSW